MSMRVPLPTEDISYLSLSWVALYHTFLLVSGFLITFRKKFMSMRRIIKALDLDLPTSEKMILVLLSDNANDETGECWPSQNYLAKRSGMSRQNVNLVINNLKKKGHVSIEHRFKDKAQKSNMYCVLPLSADTTPPVGSDDTESVIESIHIGDANIWGVWASIAGEKSRGILGKCIKDHGEVEVAKAIGIVLLKKPADPVPYLRGVLNNGKKRRKGFQA